MPKKRVSYKSDESIDKKTSGNYDIAYDFSSKVYQKFREVVKSIVLFGSVSKNQAVKGSDIDIIIIVDDASIAWDSELMAWYREELGKIVAAQSYADRLHVNTVTLSAFWEEVKSGTPVILNVIRYGQPLIDFGGFFDPLKVLLAKGKIRPSPEAVFTTLKRAPEHLTRAKLNIIGSIENIYWAIVDSAHAALMAANYVPPSPEHISEMLGEVFVNNGVLDAKFLEYYNEIYNLTKSLAHGDISDIKTQDINKYLDNAAQFEQVMRQITSKLIENEKIVTIQKKVPETTILGAPNKQSFNIEQESSFRITNNFKKENDLLTKKNKELSAQILKLKSDIDDLKKQKKETKPVSEISEIEVIQYKRTIEQLQKNNSSLLSEIPKYKQEIKEILEKNADLSKKLTTIKEEKKEPELDFPAFNPEVEKLENQNKQLAEELQKNKNQLGAMQNKIKFGDALKDQLNKLQSGNKDLFNQIRNYKRIIKNLERQMLELKSKNKLISHEKAELKKKFPLKMFHKKSIKKKSIKEIKVKRIKLVKPKARKPKAINKKKKPKPGHVKKNLIKKELTFPEFKQPEKGLESIDVEFPEYKG